MQSRDRSPHRAARRWNVPGEFEDPEPWSNPKLFGNPVKNERGENYRVRIQGESSYFTVRREGSWEAALRAAKQFQKEQNMELGLCKNRYRKIAPEVIEMELTQGKTMIFDERDLTIIKNYIWHAKQPSKDKCSWLWYGFTRIENKPTPVHELLLGGRCDHPNGEGLNNRRLNLDPCSHGENMNNRRMSNNNTSGVNGVYYMTKDSAWVAEWVENGARKTSQFSRAKYGDREAKELAIRKRREADQQTGCRNGLRPKGEQE
jgi:hypothetical protein